MIISVLLGFDHIYEKPRQVKGVCGRPDLIIDHTHLWMCFSHVDHGLNEVLSVKTEYPGNPDNEVLLKSISNRQLSIQLCLSVYI